MHPVLMAVVHKLFGKHQRSAETTCVKVHSVVFYFKIMFSIYDVKCLCSTVCVIVSAKLEGDISNKRRKTKKDT